MKFPLDFKILTKKANSIRIAWEIYLKNSEELITEDNLAHMHRSSHSQKTTVQHYTKTSTDKYRIRLLDTYNSHLTSDSPKKLYWKVVNENMEMLSAPRVIGLPRSLRNSSIPT